MKKKNTGNSTVRLALKMDGEIEADDVTYRINPEYSAALNFTII